MRTHREPPEAATDRRSAPRIERGRARNLSLPVVALFWITTSLALAKCSAGHTCPEGSVEQQGRCVVAAPADIQGDWVPPLSPDPGLGPPATEDGLGPSPGDDARHPPADTPEEDAKPGDFGGGGDGSEDGTSQDEAAATTPAARRRFEGLPRRASARRTATASTIGTTPRHTLQASRPVPRAPASTRDCGRARRTNGEKHAHPHALEHPAG